MKKLCWLLGLLILLGGAGGAVSSRAVQLGGTIVFSSDREGDYEIYAVNPDGTGLTQLTDNRYEDSSPFPSPDGRLIAFFSDVGNSVMNADGSGLRRLPDCTASTQISWSPDSSRLVCEGPPGSGRDLIVVDVAAGTMRTLARSGDEPNWSPDGRTISYVDAERLWVVPAEGAHGAAWAGTGARDRPERPGPRTRSGSSTSAWPLRGGPTCSRSARTDLTSAVSSEGLRRSRRSRGLRLEIRSPS